MVYKCTVISVVLLKLLRKITGLVGSWVSLVLHYVLSLSLFLSCLLFFHLFFLVPASSS